MLINNYYKVYGNAIDYLIVFTNLNCLINSFNSCLAHFIEVFYVASDLNAFLYNLLTYLGNSLIFKIGIY